MKNEKNYTILPEFNLLIEYFRGPTSADDMYGLKQLEILDKDYNPNLNFIIIVKEGQNLMSKEDLNNYSLKIKEDPRISGDRYSAILTKTPEQVTFGMIYQKIAVDLPMKYRVVSTLEAAMEWVGVSLEYFDFIENEISSMVERVNSEIH